MNNSIGVSFKEILEYQLFSLGDYKLSLYEIIAATILALLGWFAIKLIKKFIYKTEKIDISKKFAISQILKYLIVVITFFLMMRSLGVNISPLLVGSGAILVGIGLGLQNLFLDFISGIIILVDRTIKVGDVVSVDNTIGKVLEITMRTTTILTRDGKHIIFPNSMLTKNSLTNFSHDNDIVRFEIEVGVHYDSNIELVEKLLVEAVLSHESVMNDEKHYPIVRLENFGDSALEFKIFYNSKNLFRQPKVRSDIRKTILKKFRENGINIPYPMRTLEFSMSKEKEEH